VADLLALARLCNDLPDRIERAANQLAVDFVKAVDRDLVEHTPVDVTTAVSNWQASLNSPPTFELPAIVPGERGSTAAQSSSEAIAHVGRVVAEKRPGERIFLSNLAPHIIDLNNGSSRQEPAGFFQRGILVGELFIRRAGLRLGK
jgi:hypothetical protein